MQLIRLDALKWCTHMCEASKLMSLLARQRRCWMEHFLHRAAPGVGVGSQLNGQDRGVVLVHHARDGVVARQECFNVILVCLRGASRWSCSGIISHDSMRRCNHASCIVH